MRRRSHQTQALKQKNRPLGGASPHQLAAVTLAVLDINVAARIFQAAILKNAVDENAIIKNDVLIFKGLVFGSVHGFALGAGTQSVTPRPQGCNQIELWTIE